MLDSIDAIFSDDVCLGDLAYFNLTILTDVVFRHGGMVATNVVAARAHPAAAAVGTGRRVVAGGVGKLAGAIIAGIGLGCFTKTMEPMFDAVWGQVLMLVAVVVFLQWKPSGLFPAKGRHADA